MPLIRKEKEKLNLDKVKEQSNDALKNIESEKEIEPPQSKEKKKKLSDKTRYIISYIAVALIVFGLGLLTIALINYLLGNGFVI